TAPEGLARLSSGISGGADATHPNGNVYTITCDDSLGNVPQLRADGSTLVARNEHQLVTPVNVTGGTFTLSFGGQTTDDITFSSISGTLATNIETALQALTQIGGT